MNAALSASPRQNRVDPWGNLVSTSERGLWMGNRGCLHNPTGQIVRSFQTVRWIICVLEFRGRKRAIMQPGHYTELFFLDEATALAAGHRPCAECQRDRYHLFLDLWAQTQHSDRASLRAGQVDAALHAARWMNGQRVTYEARLCDLPDGTMVIEPENHTPFLVWQAQLRQWNFGGYSPARNFGGNCAALEWDGERTARVLTPRPTVDILAAGYPLQLHPSLATHSVSPLD